MAQHKCHQCKDGKVSCRAEGCREGIVLFNGLPKRCGTCNGKGYTICQACSGLGRHLVRSAPGRKKKA